MRKIVYFTLFVLVTSNCKKTGDTPLSTPSSTPALATSANGPRKLYVNVKDGLNVRATPSLSGNRTAILPYGSEVTAYEGSGELFPLGTSVGRWARISAGSVQGWAYDGYLSSSQPNHVPTLSTSTAPESNCEKIVNACTEECNRKHSGPEVSQMEVTGCYARECDRYVIPECKR